MSDGVENAPDVAYLPACIEVGAVAAASVVLDADLKYRLTHLALNENLGQNTAAVVFRTQESGRDKPAAPTLALTGLLGEGLLWPTDAKLQAVEIGPRVCSVQMISAAKLDDNPVVEILCLGSGKRQ